MNGVRRFLGGIQQQKPPADSPPPPPPEAPWNKLASSNPQSPPPTTIAPPTPSWPQQQDSEAIHSPLSPKQTTPALSFKKKNASQPEDINDSYKSTRSHSSKSSISLSPVSVKNDALPPLPRSSLSQQPVAGPSSSRPPISRVQTRKPPLSTSEQNGSNSPSSSTEPKRFSGNLNMRDELLLSLLASDAVVDSREFQILSAEEVDELKKEYQILTNRLTALDKKLTLETKIRNAAISLSKVNSSNKKVVQKTGEQVDSANRRVEQAQKEFWRVSERTNEVHKKLSEHRAGVLSWTVRNLEKKMNPMNPFPPMMVNGKGKSVASGSNDSGYDSPLSPTTSVSSSTNGIGNTSTNPNAFDGMHLFAGHANAAVPNGAAFKDHAMLTAELTTLEEKLKAVTASLSTATKKQAEMARELNMLRLEKEEVTTMMSMDLQTAEETIAALERELPALEGLEEELGVLRKEKEKWENDRKLFEMEGEERGKSVGAELKRLREEMERMKEDEEILLRKSAQEMDQGLDAVQSIIEKHSVPMVFTRRESSTSHAVLMAMVDAIDAHIAELKTTADSQAKEAVSWEVLRRKLEDDIRTGFDKREALSRDLEEARKEREEARKEAREFETRLREQPPEMMQSPSMGIQPISLPPLVIPSAQEISNDTAAQKITTILQSIWAILPSPEARAARANAQRSFRAGNSPSSPSSPSAPGSPAFFGRDVPSTPSTPTQTPKSIAELDVRSLKVLYDNKTLQMQAQHQAQSFTVEGFVTRVQALVTDDRMLIERLLRFAYAHDMLKKNADRAQKLAQEANSALETYSKQVRILEERNGQLVSKSTSMGDEVQRLHEAYERISAEKTQLEAQYQEQNEIVKELSEANATLSSKALTLADEATAAPEKVRRELEAQMAEMKKALDDAREEVDALRRSEQNQSMMLMEELNTVSTENTRLKDQLRALKK